MIFLKKFWKEIIIGLAITYIIGFITYINHQNNTYREQLTTIKLDLSQSAKANATLISTIKDTNKKIDDWSTQSKVYLDQMNSLQSRLNQQTSVVNSKINALLSQPKPKTCDDSIKYLISEGKK